ncbi:MAG: hypothetical protein R2825_31025 [Saprospiraceae bacterium]
MKHLILYKTLVVILLFAACNKVDLEEPTDGTPVFSADLRLENGSTLAWLAGIDSFYMYTDFQQDALGILSFSGKMQRENCDSACHETLTIIIRDAIPPPQSVPDINRAFSLENYAYFAQNAVDTISTVTDFSLDVEFTSDTFSSGLSPLLNYNWSWMGVPFSDLSLANLNLDSGTNLNSTAVTLRVDGALNGDTCASWQTQLLALEPQKRCAVYIQPNYNADSLLTYLQAFTIPPDPNVVFEWNSGQFDQFINTGPFEPFIEVSVQATGFQNGCSSSAGFVPSSGTIAPAFDCIANFTYDIQTDLIYDTTLVLDSFQYSAVTIIYQDESGKTFRSDWGQQNTSAFFILNKVEDYDDNEKGDPTKKLDLQFSCELWDVVGNTLKVKEGKAIWGVAYPK